ncbi:MAG: peptide transporter permease [Enterovirga sp.]|nr:peptide transporter permease [Enterovirga sp.]
MRPNLRLALGGAVALALLVVALVSLVWTPEMPFTRVRIPLRLRHPLAAGLLGTDHFGRDVLSLLMRGAFSSLSIAVPAVAIGACIGVAIGCTAAMLRGAFDTIVLRIADVVFAFPAVLSAIMLGAALGSGPAPATIAIAIFNVPVFVRVSRSAALQVLAMDYVAAARAVGRSAAAIGWSEVLPNIAGLLVVQATIQLGLAILAEAGLSYLGIGVRPPDPSWGRMLADSQTFLTQAPHLAIAPGVAIALSVLGLNLLGDGLRDALDPRLRR